MDKLLASTNEEIKGVTWDFYGPRFEDWQSADRLYIAGFHDVRLICKMWAVLMAESGNYLKSFHHNVKRNDDGTIFRDSDGKFTVLSTDLGFIQRNVLHNPPVKLADSESYPFVDNLYIQHPELANGQMSANIAFNLYKERGFQPWVAESNGSYKRSLSGGCKAVGNYLGLIYLDNRRVVTFA